MIGIRDTFYIKNVKKPTVFNITVESGINGFYHNCRTNTINILPYEYMEGGSKTTGFIDLDVVNYCTDVLNEIKNTVFFTSEDVNVKKKYVEEYKLVVDRTFRNRVGKDFVPADLILYGNTYIKDLSKNSGFNVLIRDVDFDTEFIGSIHNTDLFLVLFDVCNNKEDKYLVYNDYTSKVKLGNDYYNLNKRLVSFINILFKVFMYCYSQSYRDKSIAEAMYFLNKLNKKFNFNNVYLWDNIIKNYYGLCLYSISSKDFEKLDFKFNVNMLSSDIVNEYIKTTCHFNDEFINLLDVEASSKCNIGETYISKNYSSDYYCSYVAYMVFTNQDNENSIYSLDLGVNISNKYIQSKNLYNAFNTYNPYTNYLKIIDNNDNISLKVPYKDFIIDKSLNELIENFELVFYSSLCYYKGAVKKTFYNNGNSPDINMLSEDSKNIVNKIFKDLCKELDLDYIKLAKIIGYDKFIKR